MGGGAGQQLRKAADDQTESVRASNEARQATSVDLAVFLSWLDAQTSDDLVTADFIYGGLPERLRVATDAWLAKDHSRTRMHRCHHS